MIPRFSVIFGTAIGQDKDNTPALLSEERQYPIIEQISRSDRRFGGIQLGCCLLGISIDEGLLANPPHTLESADVKCVLATEITGMSHLDLAMGHIIFPFLLQRLRLCLG